LPLMIITLLLLLLMQLLQGRRSHVQLSVFM
jgi:hypothetical protein